VGSNYETGRQLASCSPASFIPGPFSASPSNIQGEVETTGDRRVPMRTTDKPFTIAKRQVYEAYRAVKSNGGAAGVDRQTIEQFEADLQNHL
jgi:hypothetical protein